MLTIGITGGLASGKSSANAFLAARYHWPSSSADSVCRNLLQRGEEGWRALAGEFGHRFFDTEGNLDRPALRAAIFSDAGCRRMVNQLLHPLARQALRSWMAAADRRESPPTALLAEVPLLFEAGWQEDFDVIVTVYAPHAQCLERLCRRDGVLAEQAARELSTQFAPEDKALLADHVIDNRGPWWDTCLQLIHLGSLFAGKKLDTYRVGKI